MGAYGTPDTYPYEEIERKCPKCGKKSKGKFCCYCGASLEGIQPEKKERRDGERGYWGIFGMIVMFLSIAMFALLFFFGGNSSIKDFSVSLFAGAGVSAAGNLLGMVFCWISKTKNKHYQKYFLGSLAICLISFILFGMTR